MLHYEHVYCTATDKWHSKFRTLPDQQAVAEFVNPYEVASESPQRIPRFVMPRVLTR
jgi:hypothetical protein